jgi:hypothetical protein
VQSTKAIHSRSNKKIGEIIEEHWEITAKRVISEPNPPIATGTFQRASEFTNTRSNQPSSGCPLRQLARRDRTSPVWVEPAVRPPPFH